MSPQKSLPRWAASNPRASRFLIILLSLFSSILFFEFGLYLPEMSLYWATLSFSTAVLMILCAWFSHKKGYGWLNRTVIYFGLSLLWLHFGNQSQIILSYNSGQNQILEASVGPVKPFAETEQKIRKHFRKHLGKRQKQLRSFLGNFDNLSPIAAFFIYFLLALLALALAYFLAIISCSLSCNGQVALSYVVLISAAIFALGGVFLIAYAIYRAVKKPQTIRSN